MASSNTSNHAREETTQESSTNNNSNNENNNNNNDPASTTNTNTNVNAIEQRPSVQIEQQQGQQQQQDLPLGWTQMGNTTEQQTPVRYPTDVADIDENEVEEICIVGTAGQKITVLGNTLSETLIKQPELLQKFILRSHMIRKMEGLHKFTNLTLLELYDNQIDELNSLNPGCCNTLTILDMSYNVIRDMSPISSCPNLQELYLANNKIKAMEGLKGLSKLRKVDLGANRIRIMDHNELSGLINLEELWIGKNKIEKIQGLEKLTKLRRLDVQSNRLTSIDGLTTQHMILEELYLSHNGITNDGASTSTGLKQDFPNLSVLDLCRNQLTSTEPFQHLIALDELWLSGNNIKNFTDIQYISNLTNLDTIYLEYNPIQDDPLYRKTIKEIIPCLNQIDATIIGGIASQGLSNAGNNGGGGIAETQEERARRLQQMAIDKAKQETYGGKK